MRGSRARRREGARTGRGLEEKNMDSFALAEFVVLE